MGGPPRTLWQIKRKSLSVQPGLRTSKLKKNAYAYHCDCTNVDGRSQPARLLDYRWHVCPGRTDRRSNRRVRPGMYDRVQIVLPETLATSPAGRYIRTWA